MKSFDLEKIKQEVGKSIALDEKGYTRIVLFPLQLCLACGWDKFDYDNYQIKYCAGALSGLEKECYETLYLGIQRILAEMESKALLVNSMGKPIVNTMAVKNTIELWNKVSYQSKGTMVEQIDKAKRIKEIAEADETSPIKI